MQGKKTFETIWKWIFQFVGYGFQVCSFWIVDTEETQELNAYLKKLGTIWKDREHLRLHENGIFENGVR